MDIDPQLSAELAVTNVNQALAATPDASAWVSANAGTGKTYVLTRRVLRLLLNGTAPDRILCLTYTNAAAAEMSRRVFDELALWAVTAPDKLSDTLLALEGRPASATQVALAPTLFARAIETPGGLKVQTIHAFCERLLQRFPLEAGVTPDFKILDEDEQKKILSQCIDQVLAIATGDADGPLHTAMVQCVTFAADDSFDQLLRTVLGKREALLGLIQAGGAYDDPIDGIDARLRSDLGVPPELALDDIDRQRANVIDAAFAREASAILCEGGKEDAARASVLASFAAATAQQEKIALLLSTFLTADLKPRKRVITKKPAEAHPDIANKLLDARDTLAALTDQAGTLRVINATTAIIRLAGAIFERYAQAKRQRAALDYDDLIIKTVALLGSERDAQWVLYKLDNGLEHILVDEAQDTSPIQWRIISRLAEEFFSGQGISPTIRTLFAVGDEKQSIYGFQGARPEMFAEMGNRFRDLAAHVKHDLHRVPLTMSFRTVAPVLDAVDTTFASPEARSGMTAGDEEIQHVAHRSAEPGLVELWPTEKLDEPSDVSAWRPLEEPSTSLPIERLAQRVAACISGWIERGDRLPSTGKPITPGDILVLVRRRNPVAPTLIRALKSAGIAVAGADRIRIVDQIAVMDMMALGDFVLLPEDDLALATVLKSPLFGFDDDDLLAIGGKRKGSLWNALLARRDDNDRFLQAVATLTRWRARADYAPPFEFFSTILERDGRRRIMLSRLGPEAGDALDEFLNQAIQYDHRHPPSLQGFLTWLRDGDLQVKRDMEQGRDEVRIMTVHGAKGLEAPIVFLPDTCSVMSAGRGPTVVPLPRKDKKSGAALHDIEPFLWSIKGTSEVAAVRDAKDAVKTLDDQEYRRLLYVAMTRARDRLYIAGYEGKTALPANCWYNLAAAALKPQMTEVMDESGRVIWRMEKASGQDKRPLEPDVEALRPTPPMPDWLLKPARVETIRSIPVTPSRIMPLEEETSIESDMENEMLASEVAASPLEMSDNRRFQRGLLTHALLQHLPELPPTERRHAAQRFVDARGRDLPDRLKTSVVDETLAILEADAYAELFSTSSQAEVAIAAEIENPNSGGRPLHVTGTIDRLIVDAETVHFVDYKTNRPPPKKEADVIAAYVAQLAAYRLVLARLYPGRRLKASLLWTDGARIMTIPDERLDAVEPLLWSSMRGLDAAVSTSYVKVS